MIPILEDIIRGLLNGTMTHEEAAAYLALHEGLEQRLDAAEQVSVEESHVILDIVDERARQRAKWGTQSHPSFDLALKGRGTCEVRRMCAEYEVPTELRAKYLCQHAAELGELTWMHILVEEVSEVASAFNDEWKLREELVQVGAVVTAWLEYLDTHRLVQEGDPAAEAYMPAS